MSRLPYADRDSASAEVREVFRQLEEGEGRVANVYRMVGHSQAALPPLVGLGYALLTRAELDAKLREIAVLRVAMLGGSRYIGDMAANAIRQFGRIDIYVDCVGNAEPSDPPDSKNISEQIHEVNLLGQFRCAAAIVPHMLERQSGSMVFTTSTAKDGVLLNSKYKGRANRVSYAASKAGLVGMMLAMANDLAEHNIRVNCVCPGPTSDLEEGGIGKLTQLGRWGKPIEVANAILYLVSDEASYITGETLFVSGGLRAGGYNRSLVSQVS